MRDHYAMPEQRRLKKVTLTSVGEDMEQLEVSYTAGGNVKAAKPFHRRKFL